MRAIYQVTHAIVQSALAQTLLVIWQLTMTMDIPSIIGGTVTLMFFIGVYGLVLTILLSRLPYLPRTVLVTVLSSLLTTFTLMIYPELGFNVEWWILFIVLIFASVLAHLLLYGSRPREPARV